MATTAYSFTQEKLKTKVKFSLVINGKATGYLVKEKFNSGTIKWYPFRYFPEYKSPEPKYQKIKFVGTTYGKVPTVGFSDNAYRGFGFTRPQGVDSFFRYLEANIKSPLSGVMFTNKRTLMHGSTLHINISDFNQIRRRTKSITDNFRRDQIFLHKTVMSELLPKEITPPDQYTYTEGSLERFMSKYAVDSIKLNTRDVESVVDKLDVQKQAILTTKKAVDRVYIEKVVDEFTELSSTKSNTEALEEKWHQFFKRNPWTFSTVFSYPTVHFKDKFNVSGHNLSGSTDKIIDFLLKNKLTQNIAFVEIKTHKTPLVQNLPYRKPDIYSVSRDLTGTIVQVMDQRTNFLKNFHSLKGEANIESLNSKCLIIIGSLSDIKDKNKRSSFELFRMSNKDVEIVTFDELHTKVSTLLGLFTK